VASGGGGAAGRTSSVSTTGVPKSPPTARSSASWATSRWFSATSRACRWRASWTSARVVSMRVPTPAFCWSKASWRSFSNSDTSARISSMRVRLLCSAT